MGKNMSIEYSDLEYYMKWCKRKSELKFNPQDRHFPILNNHIYWAEMGCNIGSEENKYRPILIIRSRRNSPIVTVLPLTTQRLNDDREYHVDLEEISSTVLTEQMRVIDISRITKPMRRNGRIVAITQKDWDNINEQIRRNYLLSPLQSFLK
jgi:mRNA interferase MazF